MELTAVQTVQLYTEFSFTKTPLILQAFDFKNGDFQDSDLICMELTQDMTRRGGGHNLSPILQAY